MKLQLALDDLPFDDALLLTEKVQNEIDIIEIGTPFLLREGMHAVCTLRERFPKKEILADTKIMDAGEYEAALAFQAGADYCTVLGVTDIRTIQGCLKAAAEYGKNVFADMICVKSVPQKVKELEAAGVDHISVHVGIDRQAAGETPLLALRQMKMLCTRSRLSVAGGINAHTAQEYRNAGADIVIVGGGITHAADPVAAAKEIRKRLQTDEA